MNGVMRGLVLGALITSAGTVLAHAEHTHDEPAHIQPSATQDGAKPTEGAAIQQEDQTIYTCPMHPEVRQHQPEQCPKCGMNLEVKIVEPNSKEPHGEASSSDAQSDAHSAGSTEAGTDGQHQHHHQ